MRRWAAGLVLAAMTLGLMAQTGRAAELELAAPSSILMEKTTGEVLYEDNADEKLRPASVTKVMTLLLVMEALESGSLGCRGGKGRKSDLSGGKRAAAADGDAQVGGGFVSKRLRVRAGRAYRRERGSVCTEDERAGAGAGYGEHALCQLHGAG